MKGNFQIIVTGVFISSAVIGLLVFSGVIPIGSQKANVGAQGTVVLWGTVKANDIFPVLEDFNNANKTFVVKYVQKFPETFDKELLEALASGTGPDMFFLPDDLAYSYRNRIFSIPYETYPAAAFKANFLSAGEVFLTSKGILAFPIAVDPLVMYYNRNILDANNIVYPPISWDEFAALVPVLTLKNEEKQIIKSAVSLGQFSNVTHAKDILATLFMQSGNPIVTEKDGNFLSVLNEFIGQNNLDFILRFYTDFADPLKEVYSWNRSLPQSIDAFSAEDLAFYFGYASELKSLIDRNPNQNFQVAPMPQTKGTNFKLTSARVTGVAVSSFSKNFNTAFTASSLMATGDFAGRFATAIGAIPVRRDLIASIKLTDQYSPTFYASALYARSWLDPAPEETNDIFRRMIEGVLSNSVSYGDALKDAEAKIGRLLGN